MNGWFRREQKNDTPHAPNEEIVDDSVEVCPSTQRPGKFNDLGDFFEPVGDQTRTLQKYEPTPTRDLYVSQIVHIEDRNKCSRIRGRIVLLILKHSGSYTCLSFCRHDQQHMVRSQHCQNHAKPVTGASAQTEADQDCAVIHVDAGSPMLKQDVYINVHKHWNLETVDGVRFEVLGKVPEEHWKATRHYIAEAFTEALNDPEPRSSYTGSRGEKSTAEKVTVPSPEKHTRTPKGHSKEHKPHSPSKKACHKGDRMPWSSRHSSSRRSTATFSNYHRK